MKNIHVVTPLVTDELPTDEDFAQFRDLSVSFTFSSLDAGPVSIESEIDEALAVPGTIQNVTRAQRAGADAVVIDCFGDPGMRPAREAVSIPVIGPGQSSMCLASQLGHSFGVVTVLDSVIPMIENAARIYGLGNKLTSVRSIDIPVLELEDDKSQLHESLSIEALRTVQEDRAHVVILGCTGFFGCADAISKFLREQIGSYVPVIDPITTAIATAIAACHLELRMSELTYNEPRKKTIVGYDDLLNK